MSAIRYVLAVEATGEIVRTVSCVAEQVAVQAQAGEVLLPSGDATPNTHYVDDGAVVAYTEVQREAKAARPTHPAEWSNTAMAWVDLRDLDAVKADKWTELKAARDVAEFGGFAWDGSTFDSDAISQSRIQGAAQLATLAMLASEGFSIDWTCADNSVRTLSGADMIAVGTAMGTHIGTVHAIGRTLRAAIDAAELVDDLEEITWPD